MRGTLEERNGMLYVCSQANDFENPIKRKLFYPIGVKAREFPAGIGEQVKSTGKGIYILADRCVPGLEWRLVNGDQTMPEITEEEPIEKPRAKTTRYVRGRWEKFTQARGWEVA